jgi:N-acetyl-1-D-myo-inositol-2-amino-2-deoxy-alpha-D-glucopyranoside deacetylase
MGPFVRLDSVEQFGFGVPDEQVTTRVDGSAHLEAKLAALRAHRTQLTVSGAFFALSNGVGQPVLGVEHYTLVSGDPVAEDGLFPAT